MVILAIEQRTSNLCFYYQEQACSKWYWWEKKRPQKEKIIRNSYKWAFYFLSFRYKSNNKMESQCEKIFWEI